jgi:hypothetical protein
MRILYKRGKFTAFERCDSCLVVFIQRTDMSGMIHQGATALSEQDTHAANMPVNKTKNRKRQQAMSYHPSYLTPPLPRLRHPCRFVQPPHHTHQPKSSLFLPPLPPPPHCSIIPITPFSTNRWHDAHTHSSAAQLQLYTLRLAWVGS